MSINIYPSIAKVKRNGVYENLPGFVQQSGDADIEAMIATKESDTIAQYPHPKGSYFILNDVLYQADVDIPVSGTIAVGTNCHVAVLSDNLENVENDVKDLKSSIEYQCEDFNDIAEIGFNLYDPRKQINGYYANYSTGVLVPDARFGATDFILVPSGYTINLIGKVNGTWGKNNACRMNAVYDSNKNYVSGNTSMVTSNTYTNSTANDQYIRFSIFIAHPSYVVTNVMIYYGDYTPKEVEYIPYSYILTANKQDELPIKRMVNNARHIQRNVGTPLTLVQFSDIHDDHTALARITNDIKNYISYIDDIICTGDMRGNAGGEIASWWNANILTCVGNHDSATYSGGVYDWTGISMANRDAYYIAPFESKWGVNHTSGTSYYYKDYATQKIRLIVMDVMLYMGTPGEEATAQTAWLENLLSDAITNNYHVIIAIHAPHGGSNVINCSFSKYGIETINSDGVCNTPQTVIDAVSSAISNGLHFIGYICGHTHQDYMLDAENDGEQLFYGITCADVHNVANWNNYSDQNRCNYEDAYNIITIDTVNNLIKIVRGGGANIDNCMRTRKAICFNYDSGIKIGEIL